MTNKIEALLDAIGSLRGWHNPDSITYQIKNPLHIKSFARAGKHEVDADGRRVFTSWLAGYKACLFDLEMKISGRSYAGPQDGDKLSSLLRVYNLHEKLAHQQVCKFLKRALQRDDITPDTSLNFFREK